MLNGDLELERAWAALARPSSARIWNALLTGKDNFAVDREVIERIQRKYPVFHQIAWESHAFRIHAVRSLAATGVSQFIDCGPGMPLIGSMTHEIAQSHNPDARVTYVDLDQIVLTNGRALLAVGDRTQIVEADIFDPKRLLTRGDVEGFFDWSQPIAVIHTMTLGHCPDSLDPAQVMSTYIQSLPAASYSVITHCVEPEDPIGAQIAHVIQHKLPADVFGNHWFRPLTEVEQLFTGQHLIRPGLAPTADWLEETPIPRSEFSQELLVAGIGCTDASAAERLSDQIG